MRFNPNMTENYRRKDSANVICPIVDEETGIQFTHLDAFCSFLIDIDVDNDGTKNYYVDKNSIKFNTLFAYNEAERGVTTIEFESLSQFEKENLIDAVLKQIEERYV